MQGKEKWWKQPLQLVTTIVVFVVLHFASYQKVHAGLVKPGEANELSDLEPIVGKILGAVVPLAGILLFVMLVFGGYQYLSSGGNPEGVQKAKGTLTYAIIGIALFVIAWLALLLIQEFTGVRVTEFKMTL